MAKTRTHSRRGKAHSHPIVVIPGRAPFLGASLRCAIAHRGIHPTAIIAAQWIPGSR
jgi:hypothetical protein